MEGFGAHTDWNEVVRRLQAQIARDELAEIERQSQILRLLRENKGATITFSYLPQPDAKTTLSYTPLTPDADPATPNES